MLRATRIIEATEIDPAKVIDRIELTFEDRTRRRRVLTGATGTTFLLDLPQPGVMKEGDGLALEDEHVITVSAAPEELMHVTCTDVHHLIRTAWHVGNRHVPCEIHTDHLRLLWDPVIAAMLENLGCKVTRLTAPFTPESGAYANRKGHRHV